MEHSFKSKPSYSLVELSLSQGEQVVTESGAMVYHDPGIEIETEARGGIWNSLKRMVGGESFFMNTFTASTGTGRVGLAPVMPGDIIHRELAPGTPFFMQSSAFLASGPGIELETEWGGLKALVSREGLFLLKASGKGDLFFTAYGAIYEVDVDGSYTVDTGHMVAFESTLSYEVRRVGGWKSTFLSGEGLVADFKGKGKLWCQTRQVGTLISWIKGLLPSG